MGSEQSRVQARSWWWTAASTVAVVGWAAALLTTPPPVVVAAVVVLAAFSLLFSTGYETCRENRGSADAAVDPDWRVLVDHMVMGTAGGIAALGLLQVSVSTTLVAAVSLGVTAPWAFGWRLTGSAKASATGGEAAPGRTEAAQPGATTVPDTVAPAVAEGGRESVAATPAPDPGSMSTTELVLAWRRSYAQLLRVRSPQQLAELAARRQQLLDELERRDASGVERWLRSGARAASDPTRFLQRPMGPSATSA